MRKLLKLLGIASIFAAILGFGFVSCSGDSSDDDDKKNDDKKVTATIETVAGEFTVEGIPEASEIKLAVEEGKGVLYVDGEKAGAYTVDGGVVTITIEGVDFTVTAETGNDGKIDLAKVNKVAKDGTKEPITLKVKTSSSGGGIKVDAAWTFSGANKVPTALTAGKLTEDVEVAVDSGSGATLKALKDSAFKSDADKDLWRGLKADASKYYTSAAAVKFDHTAIGSGTKEGRIKAALLLVLEGNAEVTVKGKVTGSSDTRYFLVAKEDDEIIEVKCTADANEELVFTKELEAGSYYIGLDGVYITEISTASKGPIGVTGVTLNKTSISVKTGETEQLTATVAPEDAANKAVTWTSSDPGVATVSATGLVTGVKAGNVTITVKSVDGEKTATCSVEIIDAANSVSVAIKVGDTAVEGSPFVLTKGKDYTVAELCEKAGISVDEIKSAVPAPTGDAGTAMGEMKYNFAADTEIVITKRALESISVTKGEGAKDSYGIGKNFDKTGYIVTANYDNGTTVDVTADATFSPAKLETAGDAIEVTVTYGGKEYKINVTVIDDSKLVLGEDEATKTYYLSKENIAADGWISIADGAEKADRVLAGHVFTEKFTGYDMKTTSSKANSVYTMKLGENVAQFDLYVMCIKADDERSFTVKIDDETYTCKTIACPGESWKAEGLDQTLEDEATGYCADGANIYRFPAMTGENTVEIKGGSSSVYPIGVIFRKTAETIEANKVEITGAPTANLVLTDYPEGTTYNGLGTKLTPSWATDTVTWSSSDETKATITAEGKIQPKGAGTTTITATATSGKTATFDLTIDATKSYATSISLKNGDDAIAEGGSITKKMGDDAFKLTAEVGPAAATDKSVAWNSSNAAVATIAADGTVTIKGVGDITITATANGSETEGAVKATCKLTVQEVTVVVGTYDISSATTGLFSKQTYAATNGPSQSKSGITVTCTIDSNGASLKVGTNEQQGTVKFKIATKMTLVATDSANKGAGIATSDGKATYDNEGTATEIQLASVPTAKLDASTTPKLADANISGKTLTLTPGTYEICGLTTSSAKIKTLVFAAVTE